MAVSASAVALAAYAATGLPLGTELVVLTLLAATQLFLREVVVEGAVRLSFSSIVLLAAQAMVGPAGAGLVGLVAGLCQGSRIPVRARVFNAAQMSLVGSLGGTAFLLASGTSDPSRVTDLGSTILLLAVPILVADITQFATNLLLLTGVVRISAGVPVRAQIGAFLGTTGLSYVGYGVIALIMVVLWKPAGLGPAAAALVLAPLLVAQWAYRQHAEELGGQQRALAVLVAAIEAKAPHLAGHSSRVAELSGHMAEGLGLSAQQVADARMAGMLHDVGQTSLPTRQVRALDLTDLALESRYPAAGAALLEDLTFLRGALDPIREHRGRLLLSDERPLITRIVALADRYDLLTRVGGPAGQVMEPSKVRAELSAVSDPELLRALSSATARVRATEPSA